MKETLKKFWHLQQIDIEIMNLVKEKEEIPQKIKKQKEELDKMTISLVEKKKKNEELDAKRKRATIEIEENRDRVKECKSKLLQAKTNEEYQALLAEINIIEAKISAQEEEIIQIMDENEKLAKEIENDEKKVEKKKEKAEKERERLEKRMEKINDELKKREEARRDIISTINEKKWLARYEMVRKGRDGIGVAKVIENVTLTGVEGYCGGCRTIIPPQTIAKLVECKEFITCEYCGRILIWEKYV